MLFNLFQKYNCYWCDVYFALSVLDQKQWTQNIVNNSCYCCSIFLKHRSIFKAHIILISSCIRLEETRPICGCVCVGISLVLILSLSFLSRAAYLRSWVRLWSLSTSQVFERLTGADFVSVIVTFCLASPIVSILNVYESTFDSFVFYHSKSFQLSLKAPPLAAPVLFLNQHSYASILKFFHIRKCFLYVSDMFILPFKGTNHTVFVRNMYF